MWPWHLTDDLEKQYGTSPFLLQAVCIISLTSVNSNRSYILETPKLGQNQRFFVLCHLEIWWITLKNNRPPFLSNIKLKTSFHHHMWIQTGVTVRKRLSWVMISVTLTFDLWPWLFAWTSLLSLVISPKNFMMIQWSDGNIVKKVWRTDGLTDWTIHRAARSQLKTMGCQPPNLIWTLSV